VDRDASVRGAAAQALFALGPALRDVLPQLTRLVQDRNSDVNVRSQVVWVMGSLGDAACPALVFALRDPHDSVRRNAVVALGRIGPAASKQATPGLTAALATGAEKLLLPAEAADSMRPMAKLGALPEEPNVRAAIPDALRSMAGPAAIPAIAAALRGDPINFVRSSAAKALGAMGVAGAKGAAPALAAALGDREEMVRAAAAAALVELGGGVREVPSILPQLSEALKSKSYKVREDLVTVLEKMGPDGVPGLILALKDPEARVRYYAAKALGRLGRKARAAIPALEEAQLNETRAYPGAAAEALLAIRGQ
jgi:HEAT repeat protein